MGPTTSKSTPLTKNLDVASNITLLERQILLMLTGGTTGQLFGLPEMPFALERRIGFPAHSSLELLLAVTKPHR